MILSVTVCSYSDNINLNNASSKTNVGNKYLYNHNFKKAKDMYESALMVDNKYRPALNNLGMLYYFGKGVDKNLTQAVKYLGKAAILNDKNSQFYLAMTLAEINEKRFNEEIIHWLEKSANQNYEKAQLLLGMGYIKGDHVEKNIAKAKFWIKRAIEQNSTKAKELWSKYELSPPEK